MKDEILSTLSKGDVEKAIKLLHDYTSSANFGNISHELFLLQSSYNRYKYDFLKEDISREEYDIHVNNITRNILVLVDKIFVSPEEYLSENDDSRDIYYYTVLYTTNRKDVYYFQALFDSESRRAVLKNTRSNSIYKGKYSIYSNHTCLTVENNTEYCINMIFYTGRAFPTEEQEICIGIINLIGIDGVACSSLAVLKRGKISDVKMSKNLLLKQFIVHRPVLAIHNSIKSIFNEKDLKKKIDSENVIRKMKGFYQAIVVSDKRKALIPFAIEITETGVLYSHREPEKNILDGIIHVISANTITINVYLNHKDERLFAEFRVYLDISRKNSNKHKFYPGTYSSISYRGSSPRGGRCLMISTDSKDIEQISIDPILIDSESYNELKAKYPTLESFFKGNYDNYVEDFHSEN